MTAVSAPAAPDRTAAAARPGAAGERARGVARATTTRGAWWLASLGLLLVVLLASVLVGSKHLGVGTAFTALFDPHAGGPALVVRDLRLPRTVLGLVTGVALGVAGALIQALTRNPLADPGILGVGTGSSLFVVVAVAFFGATQVTGYVWWAMAGAAVVTLVVLVVGSAGRGGGTPARLTLTGVGIGAVLGGVSTGITFLDPRAFDSMRSWVAGSVSGRPLSVTGEVLPFVVVGLGCAALVSRELNVIALGDDLANALGGRVVRARVLVIAAVTLLVGAATAASGPIGFVGLMVPHVARWLVGPDQRWILAFCLTLSPSLLIAADVVGRVVLHPAEVPAGIVTAFVGAPILIALARRTKASGL
ncbi:iron ABC transporter permease [Luteimicrobium album]|uniref:Iron ABC transporter permease n=1 Tax=Luteimicrobium album TaxID=1054550 RepID=A0ABQ6HXI9_9MICO|nr:iron chelate uptake ABC transporter family permease subunit [Luteimicrobium album]GMA23229.1 iron ABC transporter permease [Luteimicrobium album]